MDGWVSVVSKMEHNKIAVEIDHLSKAVRKKTLLKPLSFKLEQGKILTICGGNGAGKSTLIRLIVGLLRPTTGQVVINGLTKTKHKAKFLEQFGYMPDDFLFHPELTAEETIQFYAELKKVDQTRYKTVLEAVGLLDNRKEKVGHFSKGMNQRLLLAQALLTNPPVLILDEPTNGLDPYWIKQFCLLMLKAKHSGQTVILSTHDLYVAEQIADEVIFLNQGDVLSRGPIGQYRKEGLYQTFQQLFFKQAKA